MKINTLVIDDNPHWQKTISKFVEINPILHLVGVCSSAMEAYGQLSEDNIQLIICDIEMPEVSGLELAKSVQDKVLIIFATAHQQYALECYDVTPVDFLLKPIDHARFLKSIEKAKDKLLQGKSKEVEPYFFIRESHSYIQIAHKDVLYIQSNEHSINIVTETTSFSPFLSISKFEEEIKSDLFLRVHRSYIVNRQAISSISKNDLTLKDGQTVPIGEQYRRQLKEKHILSNLLSK